MTELLKQFHFIRPWALSFLLVAGFIYWRLCLQTDIFRKWGTLIRPHLLKHLTVSDPEQAAFGPKHLLLMLMIVVILAMAGPTWRRQPSPFTEDTAPLVIALDLSETMNIQDVQPSRLDRAKQKIRDLLELRSGGRTALLCYAGSAHAVLPLTDDAQFIRLYLESLSSDMMPAEGKDAVNALQLAGQMLANEPVPGSILFITDEINTEAASVFQEYHSKSRNTVLLLAVGTEQGGVIPDTSTFHNLDKNAMQKIAKQANIPMATITVDSGDIQFLDRRIQRQLTQAQATDETMQWQDAGYWLVFPVAIITLFWFRRGWRVQWS